MLQILGRDGNGVGDRLPLEFAEYRRQGNGNKGHHKQWEYEHGAYFLRLGCPDALPFCYQGQRADDKHGAVCTQQRQQDRPAQPQPLLR